MHLCSCGACCSVAAPPLHSCLLFCPLTALGSGVLSLCCRCLPVGLQRPGWWRMAVCRFGCQRCYLSGFPGGSDGQECACNVGSLGLIPELGRSPGEGNGFPLQYSGLKNSMDCAVHGVIKSRTQLSDFHFHPKPACCLTHTSPPSASCRWSHSTEPEKPTEY